jgi:predicted permease
MFKNYFTVALRNFRRNKVFSIINVLGLSIGISASLVIYLLVNYHFSFDTFQKDGDRIYRVVTNFNFSGELYYNSGVDVPMGNAVQKEISGIEKVVSFRTWDGDVKITIPGKDIKNSRTFKKQKGVVFADSSYFDLIPYEWVAGSPKTSLNKPYQTVLTESNANLYFPGLEPLQVIGKQIYVNDTVTATVTGIVKSIEENTDFNFKTFVAYTTLETTSLKPQNWNEWNNTNGAQQLWIKLLPGTAPVQIEKQIAQLYNKNNIRQPGDNSKAWHTLQPLSDLHFNAAYGHYDYDAGTAHKPTLYSLLAVAAFLLLLGCINFINLTTAHAAQRAKEIGIRKTLGSSRKQLVFQFLSETFLLTFAAATISLTLTPFILKAFSGFIPDGLGFDVSTQPGVAIFLLLLILVVTLAAGFYPAIILSRYKPVTTLKNQVYNNTGKTRSGWVRKSLTIAQFVIAQVFIMGALLVSKQITFSLNKELGFKKDAILYLSTNYHDTVQSNKYRLVNSLKAIPEVEIVSLSTNPPSSEGTWSGTMKYRDGKKEIETDVQQKYGDTNYIKLYRLKLLAGTNIKQTDTVQSFIINETYSKVLGFTRPEEAIGKNLEWSNKQIPIVGVVADFHQKSLHQPIKSLAIGNWENSQRIVNISLQPQSSSGASLKTAISKIQNVWQGVYPNDDFEYYFLDEDIARSYKTEQDVANLLVWATGLAIFISCLGLLGLVIYTTTQRTKEIGVRKVLGASVVQIVTMISKEFVLLVLLAFIMAVPLAGMGMYKWLQNFAYRTDVSWWIFLLSGVGMLLFSIVTLGIHTIKAAVANPVKSLRTE